MVIERSCSLRVDKKIVTGGIEKVRLLIRW